MSEISYEDLSRRLTAEALALLRGMVEAHMESTGDRRFMRSDTWSGTRLIFTGEGSTTRQFQSVDAGALEDILSYGLLHVEYGRKGTPNYRVSGDAQHFYRWLMASQGSPLAQAEQAVVSEVLDSASFAAAHPGAAHHLREAFDLVWMGPAGEQIISEIGDHLRKAVMDATGDVVGADLGAQEKPIHRLEAHLAALNTPSREAKVLTQVVELARVVLRLDHRLNHIRDEADQGEPAATWEETRRAAFLTALVCYELDRLRQR